MTDKSARVVVDRHKVMALIEDLIAKSEPRCREMASQSFRVIVRAVLDLPQRTEGSGEPRAAGHGPVLVDVNAWLAWVSVGLDVFSTPVNPPDDSDLSKETEDQPLRHL